MPTHFVNLDALIPREDFEVQSGSTQTLSQLATTMKVSELEATSVTYNILRKPDFQRETANWTPEKVAKFIQSYVEGDLIPSIILWRSPISGNLFVIDGAHRLSALIAWVHDDYGDKGISIRFFENFIQPEQQEAAEATRALVNKLVGPYARLKVAAQHPEASTPEEIRRGRNIGSISVQLQWVNGDALKAESSFFKINQEATPIDKTELRMIEARRKANAVAARAIIHSGVGHRYWSAFPQDVQDEIEKAARDVYQILFVPPLETPIKTLDLPVAGRGYSAESVRLVFEFVNLANDIRSEALQKGLPEDKDGLMTIEYLKKVKRIAARISGNSSGSLGLHPAVYFYGATGRYQPTAFLATVGMIKEFEENNRFPYFTDHRQAFEDFILRYRYFTNQIVSVTGGWGKAYARLMTFYKHVLVDIAAGLSDEDIITRLKSINGLQYLEVASEEDKRAGTNFSTETKSAAFLREAIDSAVRCAICGARIHRKGISIDHAVPKREGGTGDLDNAQVTHPYCNGAYKEMKEARAKSDEAVA